MGLFKEIKERFSFTWIVVGVFLIFLIYAMVKEKSGGGGATADSGKGQVAANSAKQQDAKLDADRAKLAAKLKSTIINPKNLVEKGDSAQAIFAKLAEMAKKNDPKGKGINIVFIPDRRTAKPAEPRGENPPSDIDADDAGAEQTITFNIDDLPVGETLRNLCFDDYKFRVEDHAVVVAPAEAALDFMVTKVYILGEEDKWREVKKKGGLKKWLQAHGIEFPPGARLVVMRDLGLVVVRNTPSECARIKKVFAEKELLSSSGPNVRGTMMEVDIPERGYRAACVNGLPPRNDFWRNAIATGKAKVVAMAQTLSSRNGGGSVKMINEGCFPEDWYDAAADQATPPVPDNNKGKETGEEKKAEGDDMPPRTARPAILHVIAPEFGMASDWGTSFESTVDRSRKAPSCMSVRGFFNNNLFIGWKRYGQATVKMPVTQRFQIDCSNVLAPARMKVVESSVREERGPSGVKRMRRVSLLVATPVGALKSNANIPSWRPRTNAERVLAEIPVAGFKCDNTSLTKVILKLRDIVKKHHNAPSIIVQSDNISNITSKRVSLALTEVSAYDVLRYACLQAGLAFHTTNGAILVLDPNDTDNADDATPFDADYTSPLGTALKTFAERIREYHRFNPQVLAECSIVRMSQKDLEALVGAETARLGGFSEKQLHRILSSPKGHLEMSLSCVANMSDGKEIAKAVEKYLPECWDEVTYTTDDDGKIHVIPPIPEFSEPAEVGGRINVYPNASSDYYDAMRLDLNFVSQRMTGKIDYALRAAPGSPTDWKGKIWMPILTQMEYNGTLTIQNGQTVLAGWLKTKALPSGGKLTDETSNARSGLENIFFIAKVDIVDPNGERYPSLEEMLHQSLDSVGLR